MSYSEVRGEKQGRQGLRLSPFRITRQHPPGRGEKKGETMCHGARPWRQPPRILQACFNGPEALLLELLTAAPSKQGVRIRARLPWMERGHAF